MAPLRPMLGELELRQVRKIETEGEEVRVRHEVPALEGDFLQDLGRRGTRLALEGVLTGPESRERLQELRRKYRAAEPLSFVSNIADATRVGEVLIEDLAVRELAGKPERFEYALSLQEYTEPPAVTTEEPPEIEPPPPPDDAIDQQVGTLVVEVVAEGQPGFDMSRVTVDVAGTQDDQTPFSRTLTERSDNVWTVGDLAAGGYTVEALASSSAVVTASASATVEPGAKTQALLTLRPGSVVARAFVIHFHFDNSFIEPCMRPILRQVAARAGKAGTSEKLLIVGHTDKAGPKLYNQSLSERRARSAYAFLTFGRDKAAALAEWTALRARRTPGQSTSVNDTWGVREYQFMLQDLNFYPGRIDGKHGDLTDDAVRAFRCKNKKGLPPGTQVDPAVWQALIEDYLAQDALAVPEARFFRNAKDSCDGGILRWLGCGELSPLPKPKPTRGDAYRPYRRVEFLFVDASAIPCDVKQPDTFLQPPLQGTPPAPGKPPPWCLDLKSSGKHCCFGTRECKKAKSGQWCIQTAEPGTLTAQGTLRREDKKPFANKRFVLIAPDGQIKTGESSRGEPQARRTDGNGSFSFKDLPVGVYTLEVREEVLARLASQSDAEIRGRTVCQALRSPKDRLDVVISSAPVLREIRLPAVAHLITARGPDGVLNSTSRDRKNVKQAFDAANRIWSQARVRFDLVHVVRHTYTPWSTVETQLTETEFFILSDQCNYPNVVNVFFVQALLNPVEFGFGSSFEDVAAPAVAVKDLSDPFSAVTLAHELGHFLNLPHPNDQPGATGPFTDRLMNEGLAADTRLIDPEVAAARGSLGAGLECVPLTVEVRGATQVGGPKSPLFVALRQVGAPITVEGRVPPAILASGTLEMTGGEEVSGFPQRRNVRRGVGDRTPVEAVFERTVTTPKGTTTKTFRHKVQILVVDFELVVRQSAQVKRAGSSGSNIFLALHHPLLPPDRVEIVAELAPQDRLPRCIPEDLVQWQGGDAIASDDPFTGPLPAGPFLRTVSRGKIAETTVSATVAGLKRSVVIRVIAVGLTDNSLTDLFVRIHRVQIEGVLNSARAAFDIGDLFGSQAASVFRARADIPGVTGNELRATLSSFSSSGAEIDRVPLTLTRRTDDRFISPPFLAIPSVNFVVTTGIGADDLQIVACQAGGRLRLDLDGNFAGFDIVNTPVRGRVVRLNVAILNTANVQEPEVRNLVREASEIWAQCGIEVRLHNFNNAANRDTITGVNDPGVLKTIESLPNNFFTNLGAERQTLFQLNTSAGQIIDVYFVRNIVGNIAEGFGSNDLDPPMAGFVGNIVVERGAGDDTLAHEIGHVIIDLPRTVNVGGDEHRLFQVAPGGLTSGGNAPQANVMTATGVSSGNLDAHQCQRARVNNFVVPVP